MSNGTQDNEKNQQTEQPDGAKKNESATKKECHACPDCTHAKENKKPCKRLKWKFSMKGWVFTLITFFCVFGLIGPLVAQFTAPEDEIYTALMEAWNSYVSIILGVVATLLSIVSLIFSFHNEEEENIQQRDYDRQFENVNRTLQNIENSVKDIDKMKYDIIEINSTLKSINVKLNIETVESTNPNTSVDTDSMKD